MSGIACARPDPALGADEEGRRHADNLDEGVPDPDRPADDGRVGIQLARPHAVREDGNRGMFVARIKCAADDGLHAQDVEVVR
jgi:hypothetical protein